MTQKKDPAATGSKKEANRGSFNSQRRDYRQAGKKCKVELYTEGARLNAPSSGFIGQPDHLKGVVRGEVKGWSAASRKAMREYLLTHKVSEGMDVFSLTVTVPGPPLEKEQWEKLWHTFAVYLRRLGGGAVWRKEVQSREAVHWHCLVVLPFHRSELRSIEDLLVVTIRDPEGTICDRIPHTDRTNQEDLFNALHIPARYSRKEKEQQSREGAALVESGLWESVVRLYRLWLQCLETLGPCVHSSRYYDDRTFTSRAGIPGARKYAVEISHMPEINAGWNRYMLDHTTKAKQEQIAEHKGRHWGVINRKLFESLDPAESVSMTWKEYSRFLRAYNRLITPYVRFEGAMFGKVKGRHFKRGMYGKYVTFSNPEIVRRLAEWAKSQP